MTQGRSVLGVAMVLAPTRTSRNQAGRGMRQHALFGAWARCRVPLHFLPQERTI